MPQFAKAGSAGFQRPPQARLTDEQVLHVLTCTRTMRELSDELDVSPSAIQRIRQGLSYRWVHPEVPRRHARSEGPRCTSCVHHGKACTMDFPEYRSQGITAAALCVAFAEGRVL